MKVRKRKRIDMYVGLGNQHRDKDEEKVDLKKLIAEYFESERISYSIVDLVGGYVFDNSSYIIEDSLRITVIGNYSDSDIKAFADEIKSVYNQESVLVDINQIEIEYE